MKNPSDASGIGHSGRAFTRFASEQRNVSASNQNFASKDQPSFTNILPPPDPSLQLHLQVLVWQFVSLPSQLDQIITS
ncbi:hypothetical protein BaRGS_00000474 [Batillaria attramentaria]|uniref:Uncharacterized protein n=1 Tax=Batillaria attramentaria TaxID=370345 RepID=A0ABD0M8I3_9CAEN